MIYPPDEYIVEQAVADGSLVLSFDCCPKQFVQKVADSLRANPDRLFIPNETPTTTSIAVLTDENQRFLRHGLVDFATNGLHNGTLFPLPHRWLEIEPPKAAWLLLRLEQRKVRIDRTFADRMWNGDYVVAGFSALPSPCKPPPLLQDLAFSLTYFGDPLQEVIAKSKAYWSGHVEIRKPSRPA